jgi:hypothetical protein
MKIVELRGGKPLVRYKSRLYSLKPTCGIKPGIYDLDKEVK